MAKTLLSLPDLRYRALAEIRKQPGCSNVQDIAINRVSDQQAENNWSLCVSSAGTADANTAAHAALHVQSVWAAIMICCQIDRTEPRRSDPNYLDVCTLVVRR
jgi:hypothetical protein